MPRRIVASALTAALLAALALSPAAESAGSMAKRVAMALRVAKAADHRSRVALAQTARVTAGPAGPAGTPGRDAAPARDGARGADGASVTGPAGPAGRDGTSASMPRPVSVSNDAGVFVSTSPTVITHTAVTLTTAGWLMVSGTAQLLAEGPAEQARCWLSVDQAEKADMYVVVGAGGSSEVALQAVTDTGPGSHDVAMACSKSAVVSSLEVPLSRGTLSVVVGG